MTTHVTETTAAPSEVAIKHFQEMLAFETDFLLDLARLRRFSSSPFLVAIGGRADIPSGRSKCRN